MNERVLMVLMLMIVQDELVPLLVLSLLLLLVDGQVAGKMHRSCGRRLCRCGEAVVVCVVAATRCGGGSWRQGLS